MHNSAKSTAIIIFTIFLSHHSYTTAGGAGSCCSKTKIMVNSPEQNQQQQSPVQHLPSVTVTTLPDTSTTPESFTLAPHHDRDDQRENSQSIIVPIVTATLSARARRKNQPNLFKRATLSHKAGALVKEHPAHARALLTGYHDGGTMRIKNLTKNTGSADLRFLVEKINETPQASEWIAESEKVQAKIQVAIALQDAENQRTARAVQAHRARGGSDADQPQPSVVDVVLSQETDHALEEAEQKAIADARNQSPASSIASSRSRMGARERYVVNQ